MRNELRIRFEAGQLEAAPTHQEHCKRARPARSCTCHDLNFGGSCFNCGFDPNQRELLGSGRGGPAALPGG